MKNIVIFTAYFLPGYKGGGPIKSIKNIVETLGSRCNIFIITNDRDLGDKETYNNIKVNEWNEKFNCKVLYIDKYINIFTLGKLLKKKLRDVDVDLIYLNSIFDFKFSIFPSILNKFGIIKSKKVLLAPRGELDSGALKLKYGKKIIFIKVAKIINLYKNIRFHATSDEEVKSIKKEISTRNYIYKVENLVLLKEMNTKKKIKKEKELKVLFLSRITQKKNLDYALNIFKNIENDVENLSLTFDIYGTLEDELYWHQCLNEISSIKNINITYKGEIIPENISSVLLKYDLFLFPTRGENFGHVIVEALENGVPILISDNTPWNDINKHNAGWALSLNNIEAFEEKIIYMANIGQNEWGNMSVNAYNYLTDKLNVEEIKTKTFNMFIDPMK